MFFIDKFGFVKGGFSKYYLLKDFISDDFLGEI